MRVTRLAWIGIVRRPVAALLAITGVAVAAAASGTVDQLLTAVAASIDRGDPDVDVVVGPKSGALDLYFGALQLGDYTPDAMFSQATSVVASLQDDIRPRHLMPIARFASAHGAPVVGVTPAWYRRPPPLTSPEIADGRWFADSTEAIIGATAARRLGLAPGDAIEATADIADAQGTPLWTGRFTLVGVLAPMAHAFDDAVIVASTVARDTYTRAGDLGLVPSRERDYDIFTHVLVSLDPTDPRAYDELFQIVHVRRAEQVVHVEQVREQLRAYVGVGRTAGLAVAVLLGLMAVGLIGALLNERAMALRPQLALLRAQGYRPGEVAGVLLIEGAVVVLAGIGLGAVVERAIVPPLLAALPIEVAVTSRWIDVMHPELWAALMLAGLIFSLPALIGLRPAGVRAETQAIG